MSSATSLAEAAGNSYGTLLGVPYAKDRGVKRLFYLALTSLGLTVLRIVVDVALSIALLHKAAWVLVCASLLDLTLSVLAGVAAYYALAMPSPSSVLFAAVSFMEVAIFSTVYLVSVMLEVAHAWRHCPDDPVTCRDIDMEVASHGVLLIILAFHLSVPLALLQCLCAYLAAHLPQSSAQAHT